jgi:hypothetical protein
VDSTPGSTVGPRPGTETVEPFARLSIVDHEAVAAEAMRLLEFAVPELERELVGLVTVACGLAGRTELSVERTGAGEGRALIRDALGLVAADEPVFAAVAPGNARSLRAFLAAGFVPLGSEVLMR